MDVFRLRHETRGDHQAAEASLPLLRMGLGRGEYIFWLQRLHGVVAAWEEGSAEGEPRWLRELLHSRRRLSLLKLDLSYFHVENLETARPSLPPMEAFTNRIGAMYVMEGSTLGGQLISRSVEKVLGLTEGRGTAYFRGHGARTGAMWKEVCDVLETEVPDCDSGAVVAGAKAMFQSFGSWMRAIEPQR